jgi:hypothetical protein
VLWSVSSQFATLKVDAHVETPSIDGPFEAVSRFETCSIVKNNYNYVFLVISLFLMFLKILPRFGTHLLKWNELLGNDGTLPPEEFSLEKFLGVFTT